MACHPLFWSPRVGRRRVRFGRKRSRKSFKRGRRTKRRFSKKRAAKHPSALSPWKKGRLLWKQAKKGFPEPKPRIPRSVVPDVYWTNYHSAVIECKTQGSTEYWIEGPCTAARILGMYSAIIAESPWAASGAGTAAHVRPFLQISAICQDTFTNVGKSALRIDLQKIRSRSGLGNANPLSAVSGSYDAFWQYNFDQTLVAQYQYWPQINPLENKAFWQAYKPSKPRTKFLKVGRFVTFNTHIKQMNVSYSEMAKATTNFTVNNGLIANKSYLHFFRITGTMGQVCQDDEDPEAHSITTNVNGMFMHRQIVRYSYKWVNVNTPSIWGQARYGYDLEETSCVVGNPAVGAYQNSANDSAGAMALDARQGVNIQPSFGCESVPLVPYVNLNADQFPIPVHDDG